MPYTIYLMNKLRNLVELDLASSLDPAAELARREQIEQVPSAIRRLGAQAVNKLVTRFPKVAYDLLGVAMPDVDIVGVGLDMIV